MGIAVWPTESHANREKNAGKRKVEKGIEGGRGRGDMRDIRSWRESERGRCDASDTTPLRSAVLNPGEMVMDNYISEAW